MRISDWSSDVCSSDLKEIYRIIDEAEFVDYASYRSHYETTVARVRQRLEKGAAHGEIRNDVSEIHAWAIGGMNVFLGMRYGLWDTESDISEIARLANDLLGNGIKKSGSAGCRDRGGKNVEISVGGVS